MAAADSTASGPDVGAVTSGLRGDAVTPTTPPRPTATTPDLPAAAAGVAGVSTADSVVGPIMLAMCYLSFSTHLGEAMSADEPISAPHDVTSMSLPYPVSPAQRLHPTHVGPLLTEL
jgi:hypothetical protein